MHALNHFLPVPPLSFSLLALMFEYYKKKAYLFSFQLVLLTTHHSDIL